jgi:hypothetical protein
MSNSKEEYRIRRRGSVVLANSTVYDTSISYAALGVLAVLLARPDDAPKGYRTLMRKEASVGQASILSAFRELRQGGYRYQFYRTETTPKGNRVYTCTYIYEEPVSLEMAKRDHFNETGCEPIEVGDKRKKRGEGARVPDAHEPDAHEPDAHEPDPQRPSSAAVGFSPTDAEINQRQEGPKKPQGEEPPSQPAGKRRDAATKPIGITPEQAQRNAKGAALARKALRGELGAAMVQMHNRSQAAVEDQGVSA